MPAHSSPEYQRLWRQANPERVRAYRQRYGTGGRGSREALRARWAVKEAVKSGKLIPSSSCEDCGDEPGVDDLGRRLIEAHHPDYSRRLDVEWLCKLCHAGRHQRAA